MYWVYAFSFVRAWYLVRYRGYYVRPWSLTLRKREYVRVGELACFADVPYPYHHVFYYSAQWGDRGHSHSKCVASKLILY